MKTKFLTVGLAMFMSSAAFAGWRPVVYPSDTASPEERLERAVRQDQMLIESASTESKVLAAEGRRAIGTVRLAADQKALEAFKTSGPTAFERASLENEIEAAQFESKLVSKLARIAVAEKKLAELR